MSIKPSYPFEADASPASTNPAPLDPVAQAVADAKAAHSASVAAARTKWEADAVAAWEHSEAKRQERFILAWREDNAWSSAKPEYKYRDWSDDAAIFRDSLEPQHRLQALLDAKLYEQYL